MLRLELLKTLKSKGFWIALITGVIIVIVHTIWVCDYLQSNFMNPESKYYVFSADVSFMQAWIGQDPFSAYGHMFYIILFPLLAAMPCAATHFREHKLRYDANVIIRVGKRKYLWTKYMTSFLTGGIVVSIPSVLSLMCAMSWLPIIPEELNMLQTGISASSMWAEIFISNPLLYAVLYIVLDFIIAGSLACCALAMTYYVRSSFQLLVYPMIVNLLLIELLNYAPGWLGKLCRLVPYCYVSPFALVDVRWWEIVVSIGIMLVITSISYLFGGKERDIL